MLESTDEEDTDPTLLLCFGQRGLELPAALHAAERTRLLTRDRQAGLGERQEEVRGTDYGSPKNNACTVGAVILLPRIPSDVIYLIDWWFDVYCLHEIALSPGVAREGVNCLYNMAALCLEVTNVATPK